MKKLRSREKLENIDLVEIAENSLIWNRLEETYVRSGYNFAAERESCIINIYSSALIALRIIIYFEINCVR